MRFRKLRIVSSVVWGLAAVLLIVLWVRSYWSHDEKTWNVSEWRILTIASHRGELAGQLVLAWDNMDFTYARTISMDRRNGSSWKYIGSPSTRIIFLPYWFLTLLAAIATVATAPVIRWRFSLRTLLIATTLVAVVLGLIVYAAR